jgi:hypothetical protein
MPAEGTTSMAGAMTTIAVIQAIIQGPPFQRQTTPKTPAGVST